MKKDSGNSKLLVLGFCALITTGVVAAGATSSTPKFVNGLLGPTNNFNTIGHYAISSAVRISTVNMFGYPATAGHLNSTHFLYATVVDPKVPYLQAGDAEVAADPDVAADADVTNAERLTDSTAITCASAMSNSKNCIVFWATNTSSQPTRAAAHDNGSGSIYLDDPGQTYGDYSSGGLTTPDDMAAAKHAIGANGHGSVATGDQDGDGCRSDTQGNFCGNCKAADDGGANGWVDTDNAFIALENLYSSTSRWSGSCTGSGNGTGEAGCGCGHNGSRGHCSTTWINN